MERATVLNRSVPMAHAASTAPSVTSSSRACVALETPGRRAAVRVAAGTDVTNVLPPLAIKGESESGTADGDADPGTPDSSRLLDLQLGAVDHLLAAAPR